MNMASKSMTRTVDAYKSQIAVIPLDSIFKKSDIEVLDEDPSLFHKLSDRGVIKKAGYDDSERVYYWTVSDSISTWISDKQWYSQTYQ